MKLRVLERLLGSGGLSDDVSVQEGLCVGIVFRILFNVFVLSYPLLVCIVS